MTGTCLVCHDAIAGLSSREPHYCARHRRELQSAALAAVRRQRMTPREVSIALSFARWLRPRAERAS